MLATLVPILLGILGWIIAKFLGDPLRRFFDLKGEVARQLTLFGNVRARASEWTDDGIMAARIVEDEAAVRDNKRLDLAVEKFRELAAQAKAFEQSEFLAAFMLRKAQYDPGRISRALIGLSNSIGEYGQQRANAFTEVRSALKLKM